MAEDETLELPETGAIFTFGRTRFADNIPSHFFVKNDPVVGMACGDNHTIITCGSGRVFTFGSNEWGQLGLGHSNVTQRPLCVKTLKPNNVKMAAGGRAHTLFVTENKVFSCGNNSDGQLGVGDVMDRKLPEEIPFFNDFSAAVVKISAGSNHSMLLTDSGVVYGWGSNSDGQLGLQSNVTMVTHPTVIPMTGKVIDVDCGYYNTAFVMESGSLRLAVYDDETSKITYDNHNKFHLKRVSLDSPIKSAHSGGNHVIVLTADGRAFGIGSNESGQLGLDKSLLKTEVPLEIPNSSFDNERIMAVSCGERHTGFITENGRLFTCGDSRFEKLGYDNSHNQTLPVFLPTEVMKFPKMKYKVKTIRCGGSHTIVMAVPVQYYYKSEKPSNAADNELRISSKNIENTESEAKYLANISENDETAELINNKKNHSDSLDNKSITSLDNDNNSQSQHIQSKALRDYHRDDYKKREALRESDSTAVQTACNGNGTEREENGSKLQHFNSNIEEKVDYKTEKEQETPGHERKKEQDAIASPEVEKNYKSKHSNIEEKVDYKTEKEEETPGHERKKEPEVEKHCKSKHPNIRIIKLKSPEMNESSNLINAERTHTDNAKKTQSLNPFENDSNEDLDISDDDADMKIQTPVKTTSDSRIIRFFKSLKRTKSDVVAVRDITSADTQRASSADKISATRGVNTHHKSQACNIL